MPESYIALEVDGRFVSDNRPDESYSDVRVIGSESCPVADGPSFVTLAHRLNRQLAQYKRISSICTVSLMRLRDGIDELTVASTELADSSSELTI